jgi:hypothetical protein
VNKTFSKIAKKNIKYSTKKKFYDFKKWNS